MSYGVVGVALKIILLYNKFGHGLHHDFHNGTSGSAAVEEAPIFVHIGAKQITVPCQAARTDFATGVNLTYTWNLENGETHSIHGDASLTLRNFHAEDSGLYGCRISYVKEDQLHSMIFYHPVVGYHIRAGLQVLLVFQSSSCDKALTDGVLKTLKEHLSRIVSHFHCELLLGTRSCFSTVEKPLDEFDLQVELEVSPFGKGWDESCYSRTDTMALECFHSVVHSNLQQAKEAITRYMKENKRFLSKKPGASFVNTFSNFLESGECQEGFGQTQELQARCPDCCTLCPPGTYSMAAVDKCVLCPVGTYSQRYGATVCTLCKHSWLTSHPGASVPGDCMKTEVPLARHFSGLIMAFTFPPLGCLCLIVLICCYFRHHEQEYHSPTTKVGQSKQQKEVTAPTVVLDSHERGHPLPLPPETKGPVSSPPSNPEEKPGEAVSPSHSSADEQHVFLDVVFPPSSPVSDAESTWVP